MGFWKRELGGWSLAVLGLTAWSCGGSDDNKAGGYQIGDEVDLDNDGQIDGVVVDENRDGKADGIDTDGNGTADRPLPAAGGSGDGSSGDGSSGGNGCQNDAVMSNQLTPDILIVLDRSTSMQMEGDRWNPSRNAVQEVTSALDQQIRFGLMLFPGGDGGGNWGGGNWGGGGQQLNCTAGTLEVPVDINASEPIEDVLQSSGLLPGTPTAATLQAAHEVLGSGTPSADSYDAGKYVLLVTDGAPNCYNGELGSGIGGGDPRAVQETVEAIQALAADGIKTYVVGYDTQDNPELAAALDMMAVAGNTGDTQHRPVEDQASLQAILEDIAGGAISCAFALDEVPDDPTYVSVKVDGQALGYENPNGWTLSVQGGKASVMIQGEACDRLRSGGTHTLQVEVTCEPVDLF